MGSTHEIGHCLTQQDAGGVLNVTDPMRRGHYPRDRTGAMDERLHLMAPGPIIGGISGTILNFECVWDDDDSRGYNWYRKMRSSPMVK